MSKNGDDQNRLRVLELLEEWIKKEEEKEQSSPSDLKSNEGRGINQE